MPRIASFGLLFLALCTFSVSFAAPQNPGDWNGVWRGMATPYEGSMVVTIIEGKVVRYEWRGRPVPITISKVEKSIVTFGVPGHFGYAIRINRVSANSATASYKSLSNDVVNAADLTRN